MFQQLRCESLLGTMAFWFDRQVFIVLLFLNNFHFVKSTSTTSATYSSSDTDITLLSSGCNVTKTAKSAVVCAAACSANSWCSSFLFSKSQIECKLSWLQRLLLPNVIEGDWTYYSKGGEKKALLCLFKKININHSFK